MRISRILFLFTMFSACSRNKEPWIIYQTGTHERLRAVSVANDQVVWASGNHGTCVRSTDGGSSWQKIAVSESDSLDFRDVEGFDADSALLLSIGPGSLSRIYKTTNGGHDWKITFLNDDTNAFFDAMAFGNQRCGFAMSDAVNGHLVILTTLDGGTSWSSIPGDFIPSALPGEGAFAASGTCITALGGSVWIGTGVRTSRVFYSHDLGKSWDVTALSTDSGSISSGIFSVAFWDSLHGVTVGGDYRMERTGGRNVARTSDGGSTWTISPDAIHFRSAVIWLSKTTLLAVGPSGSDYSQDGAKTWSPLDSVGFHAVDSSPSGKSVWAVGEDGIVARLNRATLERLCTAQK